MSRIAHVHRCGARYHYRRRIHFRNLISSPVCLSLLTADPALARRRSALLSARFAIVTARLAYMFSKDRDFLTGKEIAALVRAELENELARAIAPSYDDEVHAAHMGGISQIAAEAYNIARRVDRPVDLDDEDEARLLAKGFDELEIEFVRQELADRCRTDELADDDVRVRLEAVGAPTSPMAIERARLHLLRARADAHRRASRMFDPAVRDAEDPVEALLSPTYGPAGAAPPPPAIAASTPEIGQFLIFDERRFGDVIDDIVGQLHQEGTWRGDCSQQRRIARVFAWITGNKPLGAYNHLDVDTFKRSLQRLPVTFRFGTPDQGAMARPFAEILPELTELAGNDERNPKTINRDLSTMSTIAQHLTQTAWKPRIPNTAVLDFAGATIPIRDNGKDTRPPWTRPHMERLFHSPLYTGGGGTKARLRECEHPQVHHDSAYYAPLLWYYHHACREEVCGLRADEINLDHDVPHFIIQDNDVRGRDGELAGEKRIARRRALPLHPELLRLGIGDYVRAIRAEGHTALFPELYVNEAKRGGAQFYNVAWRYMVDWIAAGMPLPINDKGKGPDIHSIRALGSSFYELDGVNEIVRADVMGHARTGTNAKHYSKRVQTEGLDVVLGERLEFLMRYVPNITSDVPAKPLHLLPIEARSRVGSGRHRKLRSDRGQPRPSSS